MKRYVVRISYRIGHTCDCIYGDTLHIETDDIEMAERLLKKEYAHGLGSTENSRNHCWAIVQVNYKEYTPPSFRTITREQAIDFLLA